MAIMHGADDHGPEDAPPFPSVTTFFGIALVLIVLWLLASGARELLFAPPYASVPVHTGEPVGSK
jgi:hypothetical protein